MLPGLLDVLKAPAMILINHQGEMLVVDTDLMFRDLLKRSDYSVLPPP